jgi:hypothetical protein
MSIGWSSFVTGFAKQATSLIQERDKEIQDLINERLEKMNQDAKEARKTGASRKEELTSVSNSLIALGLPESEIASLIQSQGVERAKQTAELLQKKELTGGLTPDRLQRMTAGLPKTDTSLQGTIERLSTPVAEPVAPVQMERAFGLGGGRRAAEFEERAGMLQTGVPEMPRATGPGLDLSVFAEEEEEDSPTIKQLQGRLADQAVKNNMSVDDFIKNTDEGASLAARISGRRLQGGDEEDKARTASQIRTLVNSRLQEEIAPLQFKSITYDPNLQDFVITIPGSPEAKQFLERRRNVAADVFKNAGLLKGNRLSDRNAADAISPFAEVDYDKLTIKRWRPVAGSTEGSAPAAGEQPAAPTPTPTPKPDSTPAGARPIPRDADGKVDKSKLVAGEKYSSSTGDVRIWNGTTFQPPK